MKETVRVLVTKEDIQSRIKALADELNKRYADLPEGESVLVVGVLKGCFIFMADLVQYANFSLKIDFMICSSYGNATESTGMLKIKKDIGEQVEGAHVLIVEDIVDSGNTLYMLKKHFMDKNPKSITVCSLLDKPDRRVVDVVADYVGFTIPDEFVVGYGLDYAQRYRNLPYIGVVSFEEE